MKSGIIGGSDERPAMSVPGVLYCDDTRFLFPFLSPPRHFMYCTLHLLL